MGAIISSRLFTGRGYDGKHLLANCAIVHDNLDESVRATERPNAFQKVVLMTLIETNKQLLRAGTKEGYVEDLRRKCGKT